MTWLCLQFLMDQNQWEQLLAKDRFEEAPFGFVPAEDWCQ